MCINASIHIYVYVHIQKSDTGKSVPVAAEGFGGMTASTIVFCTPITLPLHNFSPPAHFDKTKGC